MVNLFRAIKGSDQFLKMEVNALLFVEYTCMREETKFGIWSDSNYFAFSFSGKKMWRTIYHSYEMNEGDMLFVKKGANLTHQFFDDDFCAIFVFIPDDFITGFMKRNGIVHNILKNDISGQDAVLRLQHDEFLQNYCHSIRSYLTLSQKPHEQLIIHKFEELLLSLFSNKNHQALTDYFISLAYSREYQMSRIMEANFAYNLKLESYAELCNMSLSKFKKSFKQHYQTTPALWLKNKKLDLALHRLHTTDLSISQISFECGFEDVSHFIRVFKVKYNVTPLRHRQDHSKISDNTI